MKILDFFFSLLIVNVVNEPSNEFKFSGQLKENCTNYQKGMAKALKFSFNNIYFLS